MTLNEHAAAILRGQGYVRLSPIHNATLAALQALYIEAFDAGALAMREAAKSCLYDDSDPWDDDVKFYAGLVMNDIIAIDPASLRTTK